LAHPKLFAKFTTSSKIITKITHIVAATTTMSANATTTITAMATIIMTTMMRIIGIAS
jgi:hypothetical protein